MEGSSGLRFSREFEEGPGQKQEIEKWRGPVTLSLSGFQERGPGQKEEIKKWRGPVTSSLSSFNKGDPSRIKICFLDIATNR